MQLSEIVDAVIACPANMRGGACTCMVLITPLSDEQRVLVRMACNGRSSKHLPRVLHYNYEQQHWIYGPDFPERPRVTRERDSMDVLRELARENNCIVLPVSDHVASLAAECLSLYKRPVTADAVAALVTEWADAGVAFNAEELWDQWYDFKDNT